MELRKAPSAREESAQARPLRIAILGTRGIPAAYGGFETFAEQLAVRLAVRGHQVTVYGRTNSVDPTLDGQLYRGVRLVVLPAPTRKHLETVVHTWRAARHACREEFDFALVCNSANFGVLPLLRRAGIATALAVDGIESERRKWGVLGRSFYRLAAVLGPRFSDVVVADCRVIEQHIRARGVRNVTMIAYGALPPAARGTGTLERLGVTPGRYVLYVSRLEPENNADVVIRGYLASGVEEELVVVGDAPYADAYKARLRELAARSPKVKMVGAVYGAGYDELRAHAACYVQATDVGGTHPALLEAMAASLPVIANDIPEHREVLGDAGWYYAKNDPDDLAARLREVLLLPGAEQARKERSRAALARVTALYDWERVTDDYERLARRLARRGA
ncbi:MAG TPA: glycosyltransferase [Candidatus Binatia bacterium]